MGSEAELFEWFREELVPALQATDWIESPNHASQSSVREDCRYSGGPNCSTTNGAEWHAEEGSFAFPWERREVLRKYNRLVSGIRVEQIRGGMDSCESEGNPFAPSRWLGFGSALGFAAHDIFDSQWMPGYDGYNESNDSRRRGPS